MFELLHNHKLPNYAYNMLHDMICKPSLQYIRSDKYLVKIHNDPLSFQLHDIFVIQLTVELLLMLQDILRISITFPLYQILELC